MIEFIGIAIGAGVVSALTLIKPRPFARGVALGVLGTLMLLINSLSSLKDNRAVMEGSVKTVCKYSAKPNRCQELMCEK